MDSHGQLITLQFGTVSNWTGAHFWNLQDELHGLADSGADAASSRFDGRVLYDESSSSSASPNSSFTPRLLSFDEPDALGPGLLSNSSAARNLDDDVALAASAATWGGRAVGVPGGGGSGAAATSPSAFAAALAAAEREERRRVRRGGGGGGREAFNDDSSRSSSSSSSSSKLASAARRLSLPGGVSSWADFLKAPLAKGQGTVHSSKALGWLPPQPQPLSSSSSSAAPAPLQFVPGARRPGWGPPPDSSSQQRSCADAVEEGARRLAERCDRLGGFLTFADDARGWGSSAAEAAALLRDEFSRTPRLLFALRPPDSLFGKSGRGGVSASAVASAFSAGALAPLVDLFVPLNPPSTLWNSPSSFSPCDALFRWSAAAAAAIDAATTPLRLLRSEGGGGGGEEHSSSSSSSSIGGLCAASLVALLAGPRGGSLAALAAALPLSGVPVSAGGAAGAAAGAAAAAAEQQQQQQRERGGRGAERAPPPPPWVSPPAVSCWTPGLGRGRHSLLFAEGSLLAESVTMRGALSLQSPSPSRRRLSAGEAAGALERVLAAEGSRAVRHLCVSPAPLHLPLPFPEGMLPTWCYERGGGKSGGGGNREEESLGGGAPTLVRLAASRALSALAADSADLLTLGGEAPSSSRSSRSSSLSHASGLRSSRADGTSSSLAGSLVPLLESWGLGDSAGGGEATAAAEAARELADEYRGGGSDGVLSSGDDGSEDED